MKVIGYTNNSYPERRNIITGNLHPLKKVKSLNLYYPQTAIKKIPFVGKNKTISFEEIVFETQEIDGLHLFNSVTKKNIPWISTFETFIPRTTATSFLNNTTSQRKYKKNKKKVEEYVKLIASDNCKKIIAFSKHNMEMEKTLLEEFPEYKTTIENKMIHLNPPQEKLMEEIEAEKKQINSNLKFLFVGKDFIRKGGREIVDVFYKIKKETNLNFELNIVSLGKAYNYAFREYQDSEDEIKEVKRKINSSDWINFYETVENEKLLNMMRTTDIGLLPTWADTYGYSVLEFQANACPVITTNLRALPEINNTDVGWMINLPVDEAGEIIIKTFEEKQKIRKQLQSSLEKIVLDILTNPQQIKKKSLTSYKRVSSEHSVSEYMNELSKIYSKEF